MGGIFGTAKSETRKSPGFQSSPCRRQENLWTWLNLSGSRWTMRNSCVPSKSTCGQPAPAAGVGRYNPASDERERSLRNGKAPTGLREPAISRHERGPAGNHIAEREIAVAAREEAVLSREEAVHAQEEALQATSEIGRA